MLQRAIDGVLDGFGQPASLQRALHDCPALRTRIQPDEASIALADVTRWEQLGMHAPLAWPRRERGDLLGWRVGANGRYESFCTRRQAYAELATLEVTKEWVCDLSQVHGFSSSKSRLEDFVSTDDLVERNSRELVTEISHAKLRANLEHREIRILHEPSGSDYFVRRSWDGRVYLVNSGGSHHLAAAKYIARRLGVCVPLKGALHSYALNATALASLRSEFDLFVVGDETCAWNAFSNSLEACRATWLWHTLPRPRDRGARAVLLPRSETRSRRVANLLRDAGFDDLGVHLAGLIDRQARAAA